MNVSQTVPLLLVSDIERSRAFYCDGLGFQTRNEWTPEGDLAWCWLVHGSAAIMLQQACEKEDPPASSWGGGMMLYFICDDAEAAFRAFTDRGVDATEPAEAFYGMNQVFVTDPDGYRLCFENPASG